LIFQVFFDIIKSVFMEKVAIILVNYKDYAKKFLKECAASLNQINYPKEDYRVYVVDNVSSSETRNMIGKLAPNVEMVPTAGNGWGHGNNVGAKKAMEQGYDDYFFFVNMDTLFDPDFVIEALKVYKSDPKIGIVQSKLLLHPPKNNQYYLNSKGNSLTFLGFGYCAGDGKIDNVEDKPAKIVSAAGAAILIGKEKFLQIGMCDESYFMYHDDIELSCKIKLLGYKLFLAPHSVVYHKHEFGRSIRQIFFMERNRLRFLLEFYRLGTLILIFPAWLIMELGMIPFEIINRWFLTKLKVYAYFFKYENLKEIFQKRKTLKKMRKVKDKDLLKGFVGVVEFQQIENYLLKYIANPLFKAYWFVVYKLIFW